MNKFIILDINHGGDYLAAILKDRGYEVIIYDIYQTRGEKRQKLAEKNIKVIDSIEKNYLDYTISYPVHCPNHFLSIFPNNEKMTHHELVKFLYNNKNNIIEITGSKGKTTTAHTLAYLLSFEEDIYLNSSLGFNNVRAGDSKLISKDNSISPGYTAKILSGSDNKFHVLEESLGICGVSDISILTSTTPIYKIKGGDGDSIEAKKQIFELSEKNIIIDGKDKIANELANNFTKQIFRIWDDVSINLPDYLEIGKETCFTIDFKDLEIKSRSNGNYLIVGYVNPILFSCMAMKILNKNLTKLLGYLSEFNGVSNRLSVAKEYNYTKIIDKSGGFSEEGLRHLLYLLKRNYDMFYKNINLVIDLESVSNCQKIDVNSLDKTIGEFGNLIDNAFLLGNYDFERFKYLKDSSELNIKNGDLLIECGR